MQRKVRRFASLAVAGAMALGAASCGGDDDDDTATATTGEAEDASATTAGGEDASATTAGGEDASATTAGGEDASETTAGGEGDSGGGSAEAEAAAAEIEPFLQPATSINIDVPLDSAPPEDITVAFMEAGFEGVQVITPGFREATEALGWELVVIPYDVADPQTMNSAVQQAVDQGVDYMAFTGQPTASYASALEAAAAAGIPMVQMDVAEEPDAEGVLACIACDSMLNEWGRLLGNWIIADSDGQANAVYFTIPEFTSLIPEGESFQQTMEEGCADCTVEVLESTIQSFTAGGLVGEITSYLQSHPDTDYVYYAFSQMATGAPEALESAGLAEGVKLVMPAHELTGIQGIVDGKVAAGVTLPVEGHAWYAVDAMARDSLGMDVGPTQEALMPMEIWTPENVPTPAALWNGPEGYQDLFKELWQVN